MIKARRAGDNLRVGTLAEKVVYLVLQTVASTLRVAVPGALQHQPLVVGVAGVVLPVVLSPEVHPVPPAHPGALRPDGGVLALDGPGERARGLVVRELLT